MKKIIVTLAAVLLCFTGSARAETNKKSSRSVHSSSNLMNSSHKVFVGVDGAFGLPLSKYADGNGVGGGVLLVGEMPLLEQVSATARVGFQFHMNKSITTTVDAHTHAIPVLLGAKYYVLEPRQGLFAAFELGMFDLMSSVGTASSNDLKFGMGIGAGWQMDQWNARINLHTHDVGSFGDAMMITAGVGYSFAGF